MGLRKNKNHGPSTGVVNSSKALKQIKRVEGLILKDTDIGYVGPHSIGTIFFSDEKSGEIAQDPSSLPYAIPRNRNNITYPVIGEFVIITQGPAPDYYPDLGGSPLSKINYYSDPISVYGNGSNNAVPNQTNAEDHQLGTYFKENVNLSPLKPGEGDTIMEGKNGQRIRFTTTGPDGTNSISRNATNDPNDGNPSIGQRAIIISLGSGRSENITADNASIYMFENHSIPLDVASTNVDSLNTTYTPIKDPLDAVSAPPEEVIPEQSPTPELQVDEIDFTEDPEGDNTVEETIPSSSPNTGSDDPFSDPVFDSLDESVDEGLLEYNEDSYQWPTDLEYPPPPPLNETGDSGEGETPDTDTNALTFKIPAAGGWVVRNDSGGQGHFGASRAGGVKHAGTDLVSNVGSQVYAPITGKVKTTRANSKATMAGTKIIGTGLYKGYTAYLFYTVATNPGSIVTKGEIVSVQSALQRSNGGDYSEDVTDHIHVAIKKDGIRLDTTMGKGIINWEI